MSTFRYEALDAAGKRVKGEVEAAGRPQAFAELEGRGQHPLVLEEKAGGDPSSGSPDSKGAPVPSGGLSLPRKDIIRFTEELADLLDSGMQIEPALASIGSRRTVSRLQPLSAEVRRRLREGASFSVALRGASPSFGELYLNLVQAGQQSGALKVILRRQLAQMIVIEDLKSRVRGALIYPSFMIVAAIGLTGIFVGYLVPQLQSLFTMGHGKMPLITQLLILSSHVISRWWWLILIGIGLAVWAFSAYVSRPIGRAWWHAFQLRLPGAGPVLLNSACSQLAHTLATLIKNDITLLAALKLVRAATVNVCMQAALDRCVVEVSDGSTLSRALGRRKLFPDEFTDLVALGEQTGDLAGALERAATRYDKELARSTASLTQLIEPMLIIIMAVMVGVISFSMMSGIFQAVNALRPH